MGPLLCAPVCVLLLFNCCNCVRSVARLPPLPAPGAAAVAADGVSQLALALRACIYMKW